MTNIEKALHWVQELINETDELLTAKLCSETLRCELIEQKEFAVTAIAALQEKFAREPGCTNCKEFECSDGVIMPLDNVHAFYCNPDGTHSEVRFECCPMCGRKLGGGGHE